MLDVDEIVSKIDRQLTGELKSNGEQENALWQHIGKLYNYTSPYRGMFYDEMLANIDRKLAGKQKHGFEQNKKTEFEKLAEKGKIENEQGN